MKNFLLLIIILNSCLFFSQEDTKPLTEEQKKEMETYEKEIINNPYRTHLLRVTDSLYMLKGRGGNMGVFVGSEGVMLVDSQFSESSSFIMTDLNRVTTQPVRFLVNTHHHGDHTGGNGYFKDLGAITYSHTNARQNVLKDISKNAEAKKEKLFDSIRNAYLKAGNEAKADVAAKESIQNIEDFIEPGLLKKLQMVTFDNNLSMYLNNETINLYHLRNAHTNGDVIVLFSKNNVLHTGDAFVNKTYPFVDTNNGGSVEGYINGLKQIMAYANDDTKIIPGHGPLATKADVKYTHDMLEFLKNRVAYFAVEKKSLEQIKAMKDITKEYDDLGYGEGFITTEKIITTLYEEALRKYPSLRKSN